MNASIDPTIIDAFVSGYTHLPSLFNFTKPGGKSSVMVNSGCFLRQLQPAAAHLKGPPVFVSTFVLTTSGSTRNPGVCTWTFGSNPSLPSKA
jgi:hypothetical protein